MAGESGGYDYDIHTAEADQCITWFCHVPVVNEACDSFSNYQEAWHGSVIVVQLSTHFQSSIRLKATGPHQLTTYLTSNHRLPTHQSAYRRHPSTETALLSICNDALLAADRGIVTFVVFLDLSEAFDTVEHTTLQDILRTRLASLDLHLTDTKVTCLIDCIV